MFKTTANKITLLRIALIPVFLVLAYLGYRWIALIVFISRPITILRGILIGLVKSIGLSRILRLKFE